jgi:probable F420-dependent oxidoreductase
MSIQLGLMPVFERSCILNPDWVEGFIQIAEEGGVDSVWGVEHVVVAVNYEPLYPYSEDGRMPGGGGDTVMPDPIEWLSYAAAVSSRIKLGTSVVVASQHSAAILAKRVATLDSLSRGRVILGVGLGWQKEEYAAIGVPYNDRGRRLDECIEGMRALWAEGPANYAGRHVNLPNVVCDVKPYRPEGVPIIIGGSTSFAARRAGRLGDGFFPYVISPEDFAERVEEMRATAREVGRDDNAFDVSIWPGSYSPGSTFDVDLTKRYVDGGANRIVLNAMESGGMELEAIRRFIGEVQEKVIAKL